MRSRIMGAMRRHTTYANVVSTICLIAVTSGTAWAAATITGAQIKNETITGKDVKNRTLTGSDIKSGVIPSYTAGDGLVKSGSQFSGKGTPYARVVVVAKSGGDYTSVQSAINSITDAADDKRYLVWVAPGTYTERVTTAAYIDVTGAGESNTTIQSTAGASASAGAVVTVGGNSTIRDLTIKNDDAGGTTAVGLYALSQGGFRVNHVTVDVSGGTSENDGVYLDASDGTFTNVTVDAGVESDTLSHALNLVNGSAPTFTDASISGSSATCIGVRQNGSSNLTLVRSTVHCTAATSAEGVQMVDGSGLTSTDSSLTADNPPFGSGDASGVHAVAGSASFSLINTGVSGLSALGGTGSGMLLEGVSTTLNAQSSRISGNSTAVNIGAASIEVSIGGSLVAGGVSGAGLGTATIACASNWDGSFAALNASCA